MTMWMLYATLFGVLALVAGLALERSARALSLPTRFTWIAMLVVGIAAPLMLPLVARSAPHEAPIEFVQRPGAVMGPITPVEFVPSLLERVRQSARTFDGPLAVVWALLTIAFLGRLFASMVSLRRLGARWVRREIAGTQCFVTDDIGPAVVTVPETRIVLPQWALSLDEASLETVVRHERQHEIARDGWLIMLGSLATALMPWNAAAWLISRRLRLAVEMDCDARVLAEGQRVDHYGSLLLAIAQRPQLVAGLAATLTESTSDLERRIEAMTAKPVSRPRTRAALLATCGVVAIAIACSMPAPDMVAPKAADPLAKGPLAPPGVYFDFQVEKVAAANPRNMPPRYPDRLREANIEGQVAAKFVVDTNGLVEMGTFEIMKSDHEAFAAAVRENMPSMRFYPARVGGRPVKQLVQMPFKFSLVRDGTSGPSVSARIPNAPRNPQVLYETPVNDSMPMALQSNQPPVYPNQLRAANVQGMVQAKFVVRADGTVDMGSFIVMRSDHELFTTSVRAAVEKMRFRPAMLNGKPVSKMMAMPFIFSLAK